MTKLELLSIFATEIMKHEGYHLPSAFNWWRGSRSFRNKNPGNLRYIGQRGSIGKDAQNFAIFNEYALGWQALLDDIEAKFTGHTVTRLRPTSTIYDFFSVYAPSSDGNNPKRYAEAVVAGLNTQKLNVNGFTTLGELLALTSAEIYIQMVLYGVMDQKIEGIVGSFVSYLENAFEKKRVILAVLDPIKKTEELNYVEIDVFGGVIMEAQRSKIIDPNQIKKLTPSHIQTFKVINFIDGDSVGHTVSTEQKINGAFVNQLNYLPWGEEKVMLETLVHEFLHAMYRMLNAAGAKLTDETHQYSGLFDARIDSRYDALIKKLKPFWYLI